MIPRELQRSTPRNVELSMAGKFIVFLGVALGLAGLIGGTMLYQNAGRTQEKAALRAKEGQATSGVVREVKRQKSDWGITYSFEVNGRRFEGRTRARPKIEPGTTVEIGYLPSEPEDKWMVGREPRVMSIWLAPLFTLAQMAGIVAVQFNLRRDRELLENGRGAVATAIASKRVSNGKTVSYRTEFEYGEQSGALATGKLQTGKAIAVGSEFFIVYNPERPKRVMQYPFSLYRIAD